MYSISDMHKILGCGRNTIYPILQTLGFEPIKSGLSKLYSEDQFQEITKLYYEKYPNRRHQEMIRVQSRSFKIDSETGKAELVKSEEKNKTIQNILEEEKRILKMMHERDAETIKDLRDQLQSKDGIIKILFQKIDTFLEIIKQQQGPVITQESHSKAAPDTQRTPPIFPEYDPNADTLTIDMFEDSSKKITSQDSRKNCLDRLGQIIVESGYPSKTQFCDAIGISPQVLGNVQNPNNPEREIPRSILEGIAKLGFSNRWLLWGTGSMRDLNSKDSQEPTPMSKSNEPVEGEAFVKWDRVKRLSEQPAFGIDIPDDGPPLTPDEAVIRFFKGRFPQRTPDMKAFLQYLEDSGFPHTRDAASTRLAKLRRQQRAAREAGKI